MTDRYTAVLLMQLESWEAAIKSGLVSPRGEKRSQDIEIAKHFGGHTQ